VKINVVVAFGGKSVEHEISVLSASQVIEALDQDKYNIIPLYISKNNQMYVGQELFSVDNFKDIPKMLQNCQQVDFCTKGNISYLISRDRSKLVSVGSDKLDQNSKNSQKNEQLVDIVFPVVHGTNTEDGALAGFIKTYNLPFVGPDVMSSALCMDKFFAKNVLQRAEIPVLDGLLFDIQKYKYGYDEMKQEIMGKFEFPVIVKPANLGSSVGIKLAHSSDELDLALDYAFLFARRVLIEPAITNLKEINCSVLGDHDFAQASVCEEPLGAGEILSYENKYLGGGGTKNGSKGIKINNIPENEFPKLPDHVLLVGSKMVSSDSETKGEGMASLGRKIPAEISEEETEFVQKIAVEAFHVLDCQGVCRIDFMKDLDTNRIFINEINTIPGSLAFYLWEASGISFSDLLDRLIELGFKRMREESEVNYSFDTNILSMRSGQGSKSPKR
jgi:D-alanine-D-alanine ligase